MQLARFLNKLFKKDGFILVDATAKQYIIGSPENKNPIKVKLLDKKLHYKNLLPPLSLLNEKNKKKLTNDLNKLNFSLGSLKVD